MTTRLPLVPVLLCSLFLVGCSSSPAGGGLDVTKQYKGVGKVLDNPSFDGSTHSVIYWLDAEKNAASLTTWGSGSCPNIPIGLHVVSSTDVALTIKSYSSPCTSDLSPYTSEFSLPSSVSRESPVSVSLDIPGRSTPEKITLAMSPAEGAAAP